MLKHPSNTQGLSLLDNRGLFVSRQQSHWDVVIVGAGPVGGYAAYRLAKNGISVLLLEEHSEIGKPFQCDLDKHNK